MASIDEDFVKHERAFLRASTAQIPVNEVRDLMNGYLKLTTDSSRSKLNRALSGTASDSSSNKHVLDYLPSPALLSSKSPNIDYDLSGRDNDDAPPDLELSITSSQCTDSFVSLTDEETPEYEEEEEEFLPPPSTKVTRFANTGPSGGGGVLASGVKNKGGSIANLDPKFESVFRPKDMRMLALVSHNNMKHSMKQFVLANKNVLKKFRVTGTNTTMTMLREVFGDDPDVVYGPSCKSGPLGGDAQLVAMAVTGELGGCIFFIDPMDSHPHSADIDCLVRQGNVHNILMMNNPCSAHVCMNTCRVALKTGHLEMIPSFFFDLESPSVEAYKMKQKAVLESNMQRKAAASIKLPGFKTSAPRRKSVIFQDFIEEEMEGEDFTG